MSKSRKESYELFITQAVCSTLNIEHRTEEGGGRWQSMQEEVTQKTIALIIQSTKLEASVLKVAMRKFLEHQK